MWCCACCVDLPLGFHQPSPRFLSQPRCSLWRHLSLQVMDQGEAVFTPPEADIWEFPRSDIEFKEYLGKGGLRACVRGVCVCHCICLCLLGACHSPLLSEPPRHRFAHCSRHHVCGAAGEFGVVNRGEALNIRGQPGVTQVAIKQCDIGEK